MSTYFSPRYHFKAKSRSKSKTKLKIDWIALSLIFVGVLSFYAVVFPLSSGKIGKKSSEFLAWLAGSGRFLIPVAIGFLGWNLLQKKDQRVRPIKLVFWGGLFLSCLLLATLIGQAIWQTNFGGILGLSVNTFLAKLLGEVGTWIFALGAGVITLILLSGRPPSEIYHHTRETLSEDWKQWQKSRIQPKKEKKSPIVPAAKELAASLVPPKVKEPKIVNGLQADPIAKPAPVIAQQPKVVIKDTKQTSLPAQPTDGSKTESTKKSTTPVYSSPSLEIFEASGGSHPVPQEELTARARLLEQTLANFNIAAAVVEIHPGPVITRYDLEPAPGVKVASIASRSADLALAMKSVGIRVLAPIPGKGAVGVEIPNLHPERVGLKELLARPEFMNHKSPIAFVLGKTVSGEPYIIDLAAMPHMLIAGATGSGKSVVVHALISSILYRSTPDLVKFVLIDPKRLELPSYTLIPHLFDPCHTPMQAEVITNSKQASKALSRLVKIMEYRYDLFAKANVRNIDSYNEKRKKEGLPPEYYLVVIIDELADLMLTSPKEVEDSIQRLAQMARAVGIHLVLATQRPSVDVITGVIKANLPARIALRVASAIDSRVIIDCVGAEILLGKGDMLFLPPASPEPLRAQGAFVSEAEVQGLVDHVKQFGTPSYDDLFSSGSALEFAVEDKKEMKDLIEALKLILERKRVSQDLLKAHFGSSARATNILSLLEIKEFIRKPEGSNRWEINFDMIEEFISKVNNIPEQEMMN